MMTGLARGLTAALLAALVGLGLVAALFGRRPRSRPRIEGPVEDRVPRVPPAAATRKTRSGRRIAAGLIALLLLAGVAGVVSASRDRPSGEGEHADGTGADGRPLAALSPPASDAPAPPPAPRIAPRTDAAPESTGTTPSEPAAGLPPQPAPTPAAPRFDVVRVEPNGEAVVAGQAQPDAVVELLVDGKPVASARTGADGQFVIVPPPLPAGSSEIGLRATGAGGDRRAGATTVAVAVAPSRDRKPLVALTSPDQPTVVLSQPAGERAASLAESGRPAQDDAPPRVAAATAAPRVVSIDVQEGGRLSVTGRASPGARVRLYLNDALIAPATVGQDGTVTVTIGRGVKPGAYTARLDLVDPATGKVHDRAEVPFVAPAPGRDEGVETLAGEPAPGRGIAPPQPSRTGSLTADAPPGTGPAGVYVPAIATARIVRGDNLWRISRRAYGEGDRYTLIYDANQDQIRDPDLIYPGQVLVLPNPEAATVQGAQGPGGAHE